LALGNTIPKKQMAPGLGDVPECKKLLDQGDAAYHLPHCSEEINTCFKDAHAMAPRCIAKGLKYFKENHPAIYDCFHKDDMENLKKAWFAASCKQHSALVHCMSGDEPTEEFEKETDITEDDLEAAKEAKEEWMEKAKQDYPEIGNCWQELKDKMDECHEKAKAECDHYGLCLAASEPADDTSDTLKTWHDIGHVLEKIKYSKGKEFMEAGNQCLEHE